MNEGWCKHMCMFLRHRNGMELTAKSAAEPALREPLPCSIKGARAVHKVQMNINPLLRHSFG